ncbi:pentatricopeptide repeat-containing protein, putative [Ricinus communis]|uniref:Pentatricopeptide repeat-containing protein, putative n=1 Tax=Ricinus communis TaxID=3988 RepID=B9R9C6_RICCO|nr:pentatricopeptide repeat-containing protein, putative [Ricinus communis]
MPCNFQEKISHILPKCTFQHLKQIHAFIIAASLTHNIQIFSKFLRRSTEFGSMDYSHLIFSQMGHDYFITEIMLWNIMIRGYAFNGPFERAISMFDEIPQRGLKPHNYTYPYVLNSCCEMGIYEKGKRVHCQIIKSGFESNFAVGHSLFNMYIKMPAFTDTVFADNYEMIDARKIFDNMCVRPVEVWNKMVSQYVSFGNVRSARELFEAMPERDVVSWNSMISGYVKVGEVKNARELFEWMPEKNVISWTLMIVLYGDTGDFETARRFLEKMPHRNVVSWNSMISSYTKFGKFIEALDLFVQMQSEGVIPDGYTFVSVLSACSNLAINGRTEDAIKIFYLMQKLGLKLNDFTFTSALFACSHGGLLEEGRRIFYSMDKDYKISSKLEHFGCLIDLLSRNGKVEEALLLEGGGKQYCFLGGSCLAELWSSQLETECQEIKDGKAAVHPCKM